MTATSVWVVLHEDDDDLAAGPFRSCAEANRYVSTFLDVYACEVNREWFDRRNAEIQREAG